MNLTIFSRVWKLDFWSLLGVYPPGLALADYWSHLIGVYPPWPRVCPPSFALGLPPWLGWVYPPIWAPAHVSGQRGKPSNAFNNEFDLFLAGVETGFLASTWGLPPLAWGLPR